MSIKIFLAYLHNQLLAPTVDHFKICANLVGLPYLFYYILLVWSSIHIYTFKSYHCALLRVFDLAGKPTANERVYSPLTQISHVGRLTYNLDTVGFYFTCHVYNKPDIIIICFCYASNIVKSILQSHQRHYKALSI